MSNDRIIKKIKKCLELSKSSNANEAATALRQAQALMKKHSISSNQVALSDVKTSTAKTSAVKSPPRYIAGIIIVIEEAFGVSSIYHYQRTCTSTAYVEFIGIGSQSEIASYVYSVLFRQITKDRSDFIKTLCCRNRSDKTRKADLFAEGWISAVWNKVVTFVQPEESKTLIKRFMDERYGDAKQGKARSHEAKREDVSAISEGLKAGSNVSLHHGMTENKQERLGCVA